ncbi:MAG: hypothetical protein QW611_05545 [Ignisphaera sp.]
MNRLTLIEMINRNLSTDYGRSSVAYSVVSVVGDNDFVTAVCKLCSMNQVHLLRMVLAITIGVDPLAGRNEYVTRCRFNIHNDTIEFHFESDDGEKLCISIHVSGTQVTPTACRYTEDKDEKKSNGLIPITNY